MQAIELSERELNAMTLQVGMVGSDGLVIASDRLLQQFEYGARSVGSVSKFLCCEAATCCWSGDIIAEYAANNVRTYDWKSVMWETEPIRSALIQCGTQAWNKIVENAGVPVQMARKVIVGFYRDCSLWLLEIGPQSIANPKQDRCIAGDPENTARYFLNKYANNCYNEPVARLVRLASYTIIAAGEENPHGVGGLEVVVIPKNGTPVVLSKLHEQELERWARTTDDPIRSLLLAAFPWAEQQGV